ncbi:MAG: peptidoglycan-binding protein [Ectothiorhodospiraceae bacterium]|nr:peptidoglycan-binding protein [Ectothiorhodospiraceae bacterium]
MKPTPRLAVVRGAFLGALVMLTLGVVGVVPGPAHAAGPMVEVHRLPDLLARARAGDRAAMHDLGQYHDTAVRRDAELAFVWFDVAATLGGADEATHRDVVARGLDPDALERARARSAVALAQVLLAVNGFDPGPIDGLAGRRTAAAVARFQRDAGLRATGRLDEPVMQALVATPDSRRVGAR